MFSNRVKNVSGLDRSFLQAYVGVSSILLVSSVEVVKALSCLIVFYSFSFLSVCRYLITFLLALNSIFLISPLSRLFSGSTSMVSFGSFLCVMFSCHIQEYISRSFFDYLHLESSSDVGSTSSVQSPSFRGADQSSCSLISGKF